MATGKIQIAINAKDKASGEMKKVGKSTQSLGDKFKKLKIIAIAAAAAITAFLVKSLKDWANAGDEIAKMADRTGVAIESISELRHVLTLSGAGLSDFETATKKLSKAIIDAGDGLATYTRAFERLGLNVLDLERLSVEEQFWVVANALADVEDITVRTATAMDLFGRSGTNLMPMLLSGAEGIAAMREEARELGYVFTEETAQAAEDFNDSITTLKLSFDKLKFTMVEDLNLDEYIVQLAEVISMAGDWLRENDELVQSFREFVEVLKTAVQWAAKLYEWYSKIKGMMPDWAKYFDLMKIMSGYNILSQFSTPTANMYDPTGESWHGSGGSTNIIIQGNVMGDDDSVRALAAQIANAQKETARGTSFNGVNTLGYFPGSSSV